MQSFLTKIEKLKCGWNAVPLDEAVFEALCKKLKIRTRWLPLTVGGFYTCDKQKDYIAISSKLGPDESLFVMFHELGHYLMHAPSRERVAFYCGSKTHSRDEQEADAFACCALLPLDLLKEREPTELAEMF